METLPGANCKEPQRGFHSNSQHFPTGCDVSPFFSGVGVRGNNVFGKKTYQKHPGPVQDRSRTWLMSCCGPAAVGPNRSFGTMEPPEAGFLGDLQGSSGFGRGSQAKHRDFQGSSVPLCSSHFGLFGKRHQQFNSCLHWFQPSVGCVLGYVLRVSKDLSRCRPSFEFGHQCGASLFTVGQGSGRLLAPIRAWQYAMLLRLNDTMVCGGMNIHKGW